MPRIKYVDINLSDWKTALIDQANGLVADYRNQGYALTLRQVYYGTLAMLGRDPDEIVRLGVTMNPKAPGPTLKTLCNDVDEDVRQFAKESLRLRTFGCDSTTKEQP